MLAGVQYSVRCLAQRPSIGTSLSSLKCAYWSIRSDGVNESRLIDYRPMGSELLWTSRKMSIGKYCFTGTEFSGHWNHTVTIANKRGAIQ